MYSEEINELLSADPYARKTFLGVYSCDQLDQVSTRRKSFGLIVNTDCIDQPGRHWQSIFVDESRTCFFFCSLGEHPNPLIAKFMKQFRKVVRNASKQQKANETTCGGYCIFIQTMMARGYTFKTLCDIFDSIENDDIFIQDFLKDKYQN
ncbi:hypothetical protein B9Z55_017602 [Caenorhabditis nigoni]|uniref:Ubiquitin-like protease family profile domain-containing protein n=1 Tax=Caenorhabditis nigoni TaxID=1611254 RepID=A0A2G5T9W1_9PELO|nr:hypothetical protein B9Z55_028200 [Caenorhabditis nigoni]PIC24174.1 hypothetical protein B9Z55_017602 [Caenorhabditis nigoni]